jgi:hypothetical protein
VCVLWMGCGMGEKDEGWRTSDSVDGAADHLSDAFNDSSDNLKKHAKEASNAMHKKKYRTALISLQEIKLSGEVGSAKEGMAVRDSLVNLEEELIYAIENGDKNAQKTYDLLKRVNRN